MIPGWRRPVTLVNARIATEHGERSAMRFGRRVTGFDQPPRRGDLVIDLDGAHVLPGLVNAHDHLELNHYGALHGGPYANASEWIDALRPRLGADPDIRRNQAFPLADRLLIGALKNLLCGVTLVAHHNPYYRELRRLPVGLVSRYRWAHSFALEGHPVGARGERGPAVIATITQGTRGTPCFVHAGEGVDAGAVDDLARLDAAGCLRAPTVVVHGITMTPAQWRRAAGAGAALVWCPASNHALFGATAPVRDLLDAAPSQAHRIGLGSDSRLTGARDLLDELRVARASSPVAPAELLRMVTSAAAAIVGVPDRGRLADGGPADFIVVPADRMGAADALLAARRADLLAVVRDGVPVTTAPGLEPLWEARRVGRRRVLVDGEARLMDRRLAERVAVCPIAEPGVAA